MWGFFHQIISIVNHGIRKETVMIEIIKNFIGNVANLNSISDKSMGNAKMIQRMFNIVKIWEVVMTVTVLA